MMGCIIWTLVNLLHLECNSLPSLVGTSVNIVGTLADEEDALILEW